jgi:hypothetical protein
MVGSTRSRSAKRFGPVRADVDHFEITLRRGGGTTLSTVSTTASDGTPVRYFVGVIPADVVARTVVARDAGGRAMSGHEIDLEFGEQ